MLSRFSGFLLAAAFYAVVVAFPVSILQRYFLGHPVAIATTVLFCVALGQLLTRFWQVLQTRKQFELVADRDLVPESLCGLAGLDETIKQSDEADQDAARLQTLPQNDPAIQLRPTAMIPFGTVQSLDQSTPVLKRVSAWLKHLEEVPQAVRNSLIARRLSDLLDRQQRRGHADQLSEDMRDLADRDADADHDTLQFVRIIVWAIPMLGFLGTVIGITQTLGGLDFTDGAAAVDRLKSGLYVAFDTTALGLVLSVIAIFLQFPVEKTSRALLEAVDLRAGKLAPQVLAEASKLDRDDPLKSMQQMAEEISKSVQLSVHSQAEIWRQTIDMAHRHWQDSAAQSAEQIKDSLQSLLGENLTTALKNHTEGLRRAQREGTEQIDNRWQQWQTALSDNARILLAHQRTLVEQGQLLADSHSRARELETLQETLNANVRTLDQSVQSFDRGLEAISGATSIADAMMTLAKAVDILATRMSVPQSPSMQSEVDQAIAAASQKPSIQKPRRNAA